MEQSILKKLIEYCEKQEPEVDYDRREGLDVDFVKRVLRGDADDVREELWQMNTEHIFDLETDVIKNALMEVDSDLSFDDLEDEDRDELLSHVSVDVNLEGLIGDFTANVRITLYSNYDCMNSNWYETSTGGYQIKDHYFGDVVKLLKLNPYRLKEAFDNKHIKTTGKYPHLPSRDGRELVDYDDFVIDIENTSCGAVVFVIIGSIKIKDFLKNHKPTKIKIHKGTYCGLYSSSNGGGGLIECPIKKDVILSLGQVGKTEYDTLDIIMDDDDGYSIRDCFGVDSSIFKPITILK